MGTARQSADIRARQVGKDSSRFDYSEKANQITTVQQVSDRVPPELRIDSEDSCAAPESTIDEVKPPNLSKELDSIANHINEK